MTTIILSYGAGKSHAISNLAALSLLAQGTVTLGSYWAQSQNGASSSTFALPCILLANVLLLRRLWYKLSEFLRQTPVESLKTISQQHAHPYLTGNFAPIDTELSLTPCEYLGTIPPELSGGQYVRNGGNPVMGDSLRSGEEHYHWFDGDGMLAGVYFSHTTEGTIAPHFVNAYVLTDVYANARTAPALRRPLIPSIALFVSSTASAWSVLRAILRTFIHIVISNFSANPVRKLSVANTSVLFHDGRALATCESGPPMRIHLPSLSTIGWYDGAHAEGEGEKSITSNSISRTFGGADPLLGWMKSWTTAHPRVDPFTGELIAYHAIPLPPYILYSVIPAESDLQRSPLTGVPVPGVTGSKLSHDFAATLTHTILLDLPLHLNPFSSMSLSPKPVVRWDNHDYARFGVFPRYEPERVRWYEDIEGGPCCVFHTATAWDEYSKATGAHQSVNVLGCRLNSASLVYSAGNLEPPISAFRPALSTPEPEKCELYYWSFDSTAATTNCISHRFALSAIPFEFPCVPRDTALGRHEGASPQFVWGCTLRSGSFGASLGRTAKVDAIAKLDVRRMVGEGIRRGYNAGECVDDRTVEEILAIGDPQDWITIFPLPHGWYAQEPTFVRRHGARTCDEDDGFLLTYVFNEAQINPVTGMASENAQSELWVIDARNMCDVVCRVVLPQRVPYGLHGEWFDEDEVIRQRPVQKFRAAPSRDLSSWANWAHGLVDKIIT